MQVRKNSEVLKSYLSLAGKKVLDVGSGEGHLTRMMTREGANVIGLECTPRQLERAKAYETAGDETYVDAFGQDLPFADEEFDIVVMFNSLHHIPVDDQFKALCEAARVLKPGGQLYISEPIAEGMNFELLKPVDDETYVRARALEAIKRHDEAELVWVEEYVYNHPVQRKSYEEMRDKMIGPNPEREAIFDVKDDEIREAFGRLGTLKEDGYTYFDQPTRMNLLQKAG
ncbi:methyltransferase domain-containing protein [Terasakiella pusilla]|uniref:class I SAM-dependent methyltransferase n=1 Tax=Terasakiella pusilla TaxID=64973 RepID=UPI003AA8A843